MYFLLELFLIIFKGYEKTSKIFGRVY